MSVYTLNNIPKHDFVNTNCGHEIYLSIIAIELSRNATTMKLIILNTDIFPIK